MSVFSVTVFSFELRSFSNFNIALTTLSYSWCVGYLKKVGKHQSFTIDSLSLLTYQLPEIIVFRQIIEHRINENLPVLTMAVELGHVTIIDVVEQRLRTSWQKIIIGYELLGNRIMGHFWTGHNGNFDVVLITD